MKIQYVQMTKGSSCLILAVFFTVVNQNWVSPVCGVLVVISFMSAVLIRTQTLYLQYQSVEKTL